MNFHVYRCQKDRDTFIVTDGAHLESVGGHLCRTAGDGLEKVGVFAEMGDSRVAFDETLARNSIGKQGCYRFEAKSFDPVAEWSLAMP